MRQPTTLEEAKQVLDGSIKTLAVFFVKNFYHLPNPGDSTIETSTGEIKSAFDWATSYYLDRPQMEEVLQCVGYSPIERDLRSYDGFSAGCNSTYKFKASSPAFSILSRNCLRDFVKLFVAVETAAKFYAEA